MRFSLVYLPGWYGGGKGVAVPTLQGSRGNPGKRVERGSHSSLRSLIFLLIFLYADIHKPQTNTPKYWLANTNTYAHTHKRVRENVNNTN